MSGLLRLTGTKYYLRRFLVLQSIKSRFVMFQSSATQPYVMTGSAIVLMAQMVFFSYVDEFKSNVSFFFIVSKYSFFILFYSFHPHAHT